MDQERFHSSEQDQYHQYRSLSFLAVVAIVFGIISIPSAAAASMNAFLLVFPFIGILLGLTAVFKLRSRTNEFTGLEHRRGWRSLVSTDDALLISKG